MKALFGLCVMVFAEFLAMGLPLPVLPMHVTGTLGLGAFVVGLAIGAQSWAHASRCRDAGGSEGPAQQRVARPDGIDRRRYAHGRLDAAG
jgi:hypothetical protein